MRMYDIIEKKKRGQELSDEEISFFVKGVTDGSVPDYQISAFLMAVYFKDMTDNECAVLTDSMARSGGMADLSAVNGVTVDKHSTGGVGDKTSLAAAPIAAALGIKIAKMSGRGLGHTGGTIDKLESIPGFCAASDEKRFIEQVNSAGLAIISQSADMAPADKRLYALRDVTATIDSVPLIASSIMSKKLAAGSSNIVLDVKYGSGAFMKNADDAVLLAEKMIAIGNAAGRKTAAVISSMDSPLGYAIGNAIEVREAIDTLNGCGPSDLLELSLTLSALMYSLAFSKPFEEGLELGKKSIADKSAFNKLCEMVKCQGGDTEFIENPKRLPSAKNSAAFIAEQEGFIGFTDTEKTGLAAAMLGAGRAKADDTIDHAAGIILKKKTGDFVKKGDVIAMLMSDKNITPAMEMMKSAIHFSDNPPVKKPLIYKIIR